MPFGSGTCVPPRVRHGQQPFRLADDNARAAGLDQSILPQLSQRPDHHLPDSPNGVGQVLLRDPRDEYLIALPVGGQVE